MICFIEISVKDGSDPISNLAELNLSHVVSPTLAQGYLALIKIEIGIGNHMYPYETYERIKKLAIPSL